MTTLQIGMTASRHHVSGTDRYYLSLLRALPSLGVGVRGVVLGDPQGIDDPVPGVESFAAEGASRWQRWRGLRDAVRRAMRGVDLVVSHGAPHAFPAIDRLRARPLVVHFHGPWALEGRAAGLDPARVFVRRLQERTVYARGARFIVLSEAFGAILRRTYGVDANAVRVIPGGVDLRRFAALASRRDARRMLGWPQDRPIVATARRLVATKGLEELIDAVVTLRRSVPDVLVAIVGTGPLRDALAQRAQQQGVAEAVHFAGHLSEEQLPLAYRAADCVVVPSVALEGFGLTVVEALACGTPALVTPVGGLPEVVRDLDPALVLEASTPDAIARGLAAALRGDVPLPDSDACVDYARRFGWQTIAAQVRDVYREVA